MRQLLQTSAAVGDPGRPSLLHLDEITVDFGSTRALTGVSLDIKPGEIVGLMGANGAGKSTLAKVMVAEIPHGAYQGTVRVGGAVVQFSDTRAAHQAGIALVHQEGSVVPQLSVGENTMLTIEPARGGIVDWPELHRRARAALAKVGLSIDTRQPLEGQGGVALMELVEVARAIARGSRLFVFDESTSALGAEEIRLLQGRMLELAAAGCGIVFISHRIDEVLHICDRVVVLRDGRVALDEPRSDLDHDRIVRAMLGPGRGVPTSSERTVDADPKRPAALSLRNWHISRSVDSPVAVGPLDLDLTAGEIVGVYGPLGAGKTELLQSIYGLAPDLVSGSMHLGGRPVRLSGAREAIANGLAFVSAQRQRDGLVPQLSVLENMLLGWHRKGPHRSGQRIRHEQSAEVCRRLIRELGIRTTGPDQPISALSGGNQQKVLLARALLNSPSVLLLDEPTRGIDVGAKQDVYRLIRQIAESGTAVLFTSMEEAETLMLADRIIVLRDGRLIDVLRGSEATEHQLLALAGGVQ